MGTNFPPRYNIFEKVIHRTTGELLPSFRFLGLAKSANGQISYVKGTGVSKGKWTYAGFRFFEKERFQPPFKAESNRTHVLEITRC